MNKNEWMKDSKELIKYAFAFDNIAPAHNWKEAFTCEILVKDYNIANDACVFFTGATLQKVSQCADMVQCFCEGYYNSMDSSV